MQTRDELLRSLEDAVSVIKQLSDIQQRLYKVRGQYNSLKPNKKIGIIIKIIFGLACLHACVNPLFDEWLSIGGKIYAFIYNIIMTVIICVVVKFIYKIINQRIDAKNQEIMTYNETIQAREQAVLDDLHRVQMAYRERLGHWYPEKYCSVDAAEFFRDMVKNYRADNLKEAINLYETTLHQRRVEKTQKQALQEQRYANVANLVMHGATLGEMSRHNAIVEAEMKETNSKLFDIQRHFW